MKPGIHSFKIVGSAGSILRHIFMDDEEVTGVIAATVKYEVDHVPVVTLVFPATSVEIVEPEAELQKEVVPCVGSSPIDPGLDH